MRFGCTIWKRALAVVLAAVMYVSTVPVLAFAGGVSEQNTKDAGASGDFIITDGVLTGYAGAGGDIVIPEGVTEIGAKALMGNPDITSVEFPSALTKIGERAFSGCRLAGTLVIPDRVTEIGSDAFANCGNLTEVVLGTGLTVLSVGAFRGCEGVEIARFRTENPPMIEDQYNYELADLFPNAKTIWVPEGCRADYKQEFFCRRQI